MATTEEYSTVIRLNAQEATNQLDKLKKKVSDLEAARDKALSDKTKDTAFVKQLNKELRQATAEMKAYETNVSTTIKTLNNLSEATVGDIEKAIRAIKKEMKAVSDPAEYKKLDAHLQSLKGRLEEIKGEIKDTSDVTDKVTEGFSKWQGAIMSAIASITGLSLSIKQSVQDYADMQESMADVQKYTGMSAEEVQRLNEEFKKINTRTSREELNAMAGAAGRLGISSVEAVLEFVDAADKISVALGDDLGDGAVDQIGKLAMAFGEDDKMGLRGAMLATGSAINELAANSSANAGYLVNFAARLAGVGVQAKMSQADIMGIAAALDENMIQAEMSATALSTVIGLMAKDTAKFASTAGMSVEAFTKLVSEDMNGALLKFFDGLKESGDFTELSKSLDTMGLDAARMTQVLATMAGKVDDVRKLQQIANDAYTEGISVLNEFNTMNNTVQAGIDKSLKSFKEISIELGEKLLPIAKTGLDTALMLGKAVNSMVDFAKSWGITLVTLTGYITALVIAEKADVIQKQLQVFWTDTLVASSKKLWATLARHPYIAIAAGVTALVAVMADLIRRNNELSQQEKTMNKLRDEAAVKVYEESSRLEALEKVARDEKRAMDERLKAMEELNKIVPGYNAHIDETTGKYVASASALKSYLDQLQRKYELEGAKDILRQLGQEAAQLTLQLMKQEEALRSAKEMASQNLQNQSGRPQTSGGGAAPSSTYQQMGDAAIIRSETNKLKDIEKALDENRKTREYLQNKYGADMYQTDVNAESSVSSFVGAGRPSAPGTQSSGKKSKAAKAPKDDSAKLFREQTRRDLEAIREMYQMTEEFAEQERYKGEMSEEQYLAELNRLRLEHLQENLRYLIENNADEQEIARAKYDLALETEKQITEVTKKEYEKRNQLEKDKNELFARFMQEKTDVVKQKYTEMAQNLLSAGAISQEEFDQIVAGINKIGESASQVSGPTSELAQHINDFAIALDKGRWQDAANAFVNIWTTALSSVSSLFQAQANAEVKQTEEKYDKMIAAAGKNTKKQEKLEKEKEEAVAKIKNQYLDKQIKIQIAQAVAQGAMAAINAYASAAQTPVIGYIIAPIAAAAALAATAIQIATIKAQAEAQKEGYYVGGYTGGKNYRKVAGVVHEGEFVANHEAVNNPSIAPALELIDQAQKTNTVGALTSADLAAAVGATSAALVVNVSNDNSELRSDLASLRTVVEKLSKQIDNGIEANVQIAGSNGLKKKLNDYDAMMARVR